ncbi:LysM peptidoglycan-binding domain-containing protein [Akkermansia glycaniphila]|uniref:Lysm domain n=1 Tax=Akkermansia glycaniphila TaxID=1679444 RepID=A0A1C7PBY6_9BACT|nr:LysM domain-containing protein [Akkermansia glycaniphila]OCA03081.1 hypothetical protein AC781_06860 [Akkermansia glycaniphila]SEH86031.1 lysm domain [Akkermansia glycaniphila]
MNNIFSTLACLCIAAIAAFGGTASGETAVAALHAGKQSGVSAAKPKRHLHTYAVKRGETLESIAKKFGTTADEIRKDSRLNKKARIRTGQTIRVRMEDTH